MEDRARAWPALLSTTEAALLAAGVQADRGDAAAVWRLLRLAESEARRELCSVDTWFSIWSEWGRFADACADLGWARWLPVRLVLRSRVVAARQAFAELLPKALRTCATWGDEAGLADAFEDLLDQVWRCEREWRLDDRIDVSLRRRRSPGDSGAVGKDA